MSKIHTFNPIFEYGGPDFESNISASFRKLREDNDFFDVTLCCDNDVDMVQAHEVILAAYSPLFDETLIVVQPFFA